MNSSTVAYVAHIASWVLLQLSWQCCLIVLLWTVCERMLRSSSADFRYRLALLHFFAIGVLSLLTLGASQWAVIYKKVAEGYSKTNASLGGSEISHFLLIAYHRLAQELPLFSLIWLAGFSIMMFYLWGAWIALRRTPTIKASTWLTDLAHHLAHELDVDAPIILNADVPAPFVSGIMRPTIVLPFDAEQELSTNQLRAILAHELIHIRYADYFWNLFQRVFLSLFWFNPAAWLLYSRLSQEREIRCDTTAATKCSCASDLAHGLVRLVETATARNSAVTLSFTQSGLETRIRVLLQSPMTRNTKGRLFVPVVAIFFACALAVWSGERCLSDDNLRGLYVASEFGPLIYVHAHDDAGSFDLQMQHGHVLKLVVAQQVVPQQRILQTKDSVTAYGETGRPLVSLHLDPRGGISWTPRSK
jgi:beta-lactamase regulating signal transducer with metallopeptidase domain